MTPWQLIKTPNLSGLQNMEYDLKLFHDFERGLIPSTLRIYSWDPNCISLGYSQSIEEEIDVEKALRLGWEVVKRPTGGGIVFHNGAEVTYSLVTAIDNPVLPKGLITSYRKISEALVCALSILGVKGEIRKQNTESRVQNTGLCFSYPAEYEVVCGGKKIVGSAQKRGKRTLLQQGSIFVRETPTEVFKVLRKSYHKQNAVSVEEATGREVSFSEICRALTKGFEECFAISFAPLKCDKMQAV